MSDPMNVVHVPPGAPEREEAVAALVVGRWREVAGDLGGAAGLRNLAEDFRSTALASVLRQAAAVLDAGGVPDPVTVGARLSDGDAKAGLGRLVERSLDYFPANLPEHLEAIRQAARVRATILVTERLRVGARRLDAGDASLFNEALAELHDMTAPTPAAAPHPRSWPELEEEALQGLAGDFVRAVGPHTEGDPAAILVQFLVAFGNAVNGGPHALVEATRHHANEFVLIVGNTGKARKGTSLNWVESLMLRADEGWWRERVKPGGLASGEGLIDLVRDPRPGNGDDRRDDPGVSDKRLLVIESEFSGIMRVAGRDGSILSEILRKAWDHGRLANLSKRDQATATDAHISVIAHVTRDDLRRHLGKAEVFNGFLNRFLLVCARRAQTLPEGSAAGPKIVSDFAPRVARALADARRAGLVERDQAAKALWSHLYRGELAAEHGGALGALLARGEAHVLRLSLIYALLDGGNRVREEHLRAALAVWRYCVASASYLFGTTTGSTVADEVLEALRADPRGLTRSQLRDAVGKHRSNELGEALQDLVEGGRVVRLEERTGGRPAERYMLPTTAAA